MSKFNGVYTTVVEGLDTEELGVTEFTRKNVEDEKHKDSLQKIIKKLPELEGIF